MQSPLLAAAHTDVGRRAYLAARCRSAHEAARALLHVRGHLPLGLCMRIMQEAGMYCPLHASPYVRVGRLYRAPVLMNVLFGDAANALKNADLASFPECMDCGAARTAVQQDLSSPEYYYYHGLMWSRGSEPGGKPWSGAD